MAKVCPGGCGFLVTWHPTHCCQACATGKVIGGNKVHGGRCERKTSTCVPTTQGGASGPPPGTPTLPKVLYLINMATGLPLHIDGGDDKMASVRYGDCRDDFSKFRMEKAGDKAFYLINMATGLPLHIDGGGDKMASVRYGDCRDDFAKFRFEKADGAVGVM